MTTTATITTDSGCQITATLHDVGTEHRTVTLTQDGHRVGEEGLWAGRQICHISARLGAADGSETEAAYQALDEAIGDAFPSWREVPLYWLSTGKALTDEQRVTALREYRATGGMYDVVMAEPDSADLSAEESERLSEAGPEVDGIDWEGFPAA